MSLTMPHILLVEDDTNTRFGLGEILSSEGYDVVLAADASEAIKKVGNFRHLLEI